MAMDLGQIITEAGNTDDRMQRIIADERGAEV